MLSSLVRRISSYLPQSSLDKSQTGSKLLVFLALFVSILLWASAYPTIRVCLTAYKPSQVAFLRYLVASTALLGYSAVNPIPLPKIRDVPLISLCGFVGFTLYNFLLNVGELNVPAGLASFIVSSEVGIIAVLARVFFGEKLSKLGWLGVVLCIAGVGFISITGGSDFKFSAGVPLIFIAAISIASYSVLQKPILERYTAIQATTYAIWAGTILLFFFAPRAVLAIPEAPLVPTLAIAYMGLFPGIIANISWSYVLSKMPASRAAGYLALVPVAALSLAWLLLGEVPTLISLIGAGVVLCGVILIDLRAKGEDSDLTAVESLTAN